MRARAASASTSLWNSRAYDEPLPARIAGAALYPLLDELHRHFRHELFLERLDDPFGAVTDDDHDPFEHAQLGQRVNHVQHHRATAQLVQHLRSSGAQPHPLAGGEHHGSKRTVRAHAFSIGKFGSIGWFGFPSGRFARRDRVRGSGARVRTST